MSSNVSDRQAIRALQTIQGFTLQPVTTVVGQEGFVLTINTIVHARIVGAVQRGHDVGSTALKAIDALRAYIDAGSSLHDLVGDNRSAFAPPPQILRPLEKDRVHTDLGEQLVNAEPLAILRKRDRRPAATEIEPYVRRATAALAGDTDAGRDLVRRIRSVDGDAETRDRYRHFGAFVMLCVGTGVTAGEVIYDVATGALRMPYILGRRAVRNTIEFMDDVGFQALSTRRSPLAPNDINFYPTWSQAFRPRAGAYA